MTVLFHAPSDMFRGFPVGFAVFDLFRRQPYRYGLETFGSREWFPPGPFALATVCFVHFASSYSALSTCSSRSLSSW